MKHCWGLPAIRYAAVSGLSEERTADLVVSAGILEAIGDRLPLKAAAVHTISEATIAHWEALVTALKGEVIYAIGGGLAADAAKFASLKAGKPLICIPAAISVDAFLTWASGYREDGCVRYIETRPPDEVIVDFELIAAGPLGIRSAGVTDVLSIATGRWDWKFAHEAGRNPDHMPYDPAVDAMAATIEDACLACAASAGRGEPEGLRRLVECLAMEVQLCNLIGHSRPEEGSEHYFAYAAESILGKGLPHGDLVGPGILVMAHFQGQDIAPLKDAMRAANVPLTNIPPDAIREILHMLPAYSARHNMPYGIAHTLTPDQIAAFDPGILA
ncbi:MAG: iron-containing alcohol dehydrogenase [Candidatus Hydrogenedentes bacterium]|nr:iron-containing alcohol dehydrogenase [Candidatus Hydrogenedentota bacterium]